MPMVRRTARRNGYGSCRVGPPVFGAVDCGATTTSRGLSLVSAGAGAGWRLQLLSDRQAARTRHAARQWVVRIGMVRVGVMEGEGSKGATSDGAYRLVVGMVTTRVSARTLFATSDERSC